jgi:hypothetical protein
MVSGYTVSACIAGDMMCSHDAVPDLKFIDGWAHFNDLTSDFMPQY